MKKGFKPRELTLLGLLTALLLVMAFTPLGYLPIGPLSATLNMIPVAIGAIALGPVGGAVLGGVFGLTSFLQCVGVGGTSAMGVILFGISPIRAFIQRFVPRVLVGVIVAYVYRFLKKAFGNKAAGRSAASFITGFCAAFFNTVLFMGSLVLLFSTTEYMQDLISGRNVILWVCSFVGVNAVFEMAVSTLLTGVIATALDRAKLFGDGK